MGGVGSERCILESFRNHSNKLTVGTLSAEPYNQAHLFDGTTENEKAAIMDNLNEIDTRLAGGGLRGYLQRARKLLAEAREGVNCFAGYVPQVPVGERLVGDSGPGTEVFAEFERLGMNQLSKCTFCLLAGGLGERLGYPGIKIGITAEVTTGETFMDKFARYILAFQAHARKVTGRCCLQLPLVIMTSGDTHDQTLQFFCENENFGLNPAQVTIMQQEKVPALMNAAANISKKGSTIETKPHGHGDIHALLHQHGLPQKWEAEGRKWTVIFQDTNPLAFRSLCAILGVSAMNDFAMNSVCVPRIPGEAIGAIAKLDRGDGSNMTINVEYNQLEALLKETPLGGDVADETGFSPYPGNINIVVFGIPCLARCLEATGGIVPEFVNPKWVGPERDQLKSATRLECMMQDFPKLCRPEDKVGFTQLDRIMCFTCVKDNVKDAAKKCPHDCALSAEAGIYASDALLLHLSGADVEIETPEQRTFLGVSAEMGARIVLHPSFCMCLEELKSKVRGKIRISRRSSLVLEGDVVVDGLDLDGALKVCGNGEFKSQTVHNEGQSIVAIPEDELSAQPPSLQIRGYQCAKGEVEQVAA